MVQASRRIEIVGIAYHVCGLEHVLHEIREAIHRGVRMTIIQPHFHHLVLAHGHPELLKLFSRYDLVLPDGYGVFLAGKLLYGKEKSFKSVFNGTDFYDVLLGEANLNRWRIFFLGDTETIVRSLRRRLALQYHNLPVAGAHHGFIETWDERIVDAINESHPDILCIGMGTPKQDIWLWEHIHALQVPVSITVGAGIAFMSGEKRRAASVWRRLHLEWLYRLGQEPKRLWRRYLVGIPEFLFYVLVQKFFGK